MQSMYHHQEKQITRQPYTINFHKVLGTENPADLFTKIQTSVAFKQCEETLIKKMQK